MQNTTFLGPRLHGHRVAYLCHMRLFLTSHRFKFFVFAELLPGKEVLQLQAYGLVETCYSANTAAKSPVMQRFVKGRAHVVQILDVQQEQQNIQNDTK